MSIMEESINFSVSSQIDRTRPWTSIHVEMLLVLFLFLDIFTHSQMTKF